MFLFCIKTRMLSLFLMIFFKRFFATKRNTSWCCTYICILEHILLYFSEKVILVLFWTLLYAILPSRPYKGNLTFLTSYLDYDCDPWKITDIRKSSIQCKVSLDSLLALITCKNSEKFRDPLLSSSKTLNRLSPINLSWKSGFDIC